MNPDVFESELYTIRHNRILLGLAASPFAGALALALAGSLGSPILWAFIPHSIALGFLATAYAWSRNFRPVVQACVVRADSDGVSLGERRVPRAQIRAGFVMPGTGAPRVHLRRRGRFPIELQTGSVDEARAMLRAMGLDASQTVAEFRTLSRALAKRRYLVGLGLLIGAFFSGFGSALGTIASHSAMGASAFLVPILPFVVIMVWPSRLRIGADGFELRWLWTRRFVRYDEVLGFSRFEKGLGNSRTVGIAITLRSGEEVLVPIQRSNWNNNAECVLIEERLREAKEGFRAGDVAADAAMLQRGQRDVRDWVAALRAIGTGANATLRTAPVPHDRLLRIVEDPSQDAAARAAAAVALGADLDEPGRARLRVAAEAIAAPKLRVAIEKAAERADDAEIEAALSEIDAERARAAS
jgi:hypothetical protein